MTVFNFNNYKTFLKNYITHLPKKGRGEIGKFAKHLRVSTTLISQILSEDKNLSLEQAYGITEYLGLSKIESEYFLLLVHAERAGTINLKKYYDEKIKTIRDEALKLSNRIKPQKDLSDKERSVFYSSFHYAAIWLYTSIGEKGKTIEEICERFDLPRMKVIEVIKFLVESQLCIESSGAYKMTGQSTHVGQGSPYLFNHYRNWHLKAIQQSEILTESELMFSTAVSLSSDDFKKLREEMVAFIKSFLKTTHESPAEDIACFNMDFFWIRK